MNVRNIQFTKIEIRIAKYLFKHFKDRYNSRKLANIIDINHAHAGKLCNDLVSKSVLIKDFIGNAVYFSFDYRNKMAIKFIEYLLSLEENQPPKWLAVVSHNLNGLNDYVIFRTIFGSSVKSQEFNDVDVLLVYDKKMRKKINKVKEEIRKSVLVDKTIRYVDVSEEDIYKNMNDKIFYSILSECIVSFNAEKYVRVILKCLK
ncbi:hypothetical protein HY483_02370 [Candidatus Woesearchaeota archaeon]|nr:hypothetical protein [Candidatus Woesearchaeota archaeon]